MAEIADSLDNEQKKLRKDLNSGTKATIANGGISNIPTPAPIGTNGTPGTGTAAGIPTIQKPDTKIASVAELPTDNVSGVTPNTQSAGTQAGQKSDTKVPNVAKLPNGITPAAQARGQELMAQEGVNPANYTVQPSGVVIPKPGTQAYSSPLHLAGAGKTAIGAIAAIPGAAIRGVRALGTVVREKVLNENRQDIAARAAQPDLLDAAQNLMRSGVQDIAQIPGQIRMATGFRTEPNGSTPGVAQAAVPSPAAVKSPVPVVASPGGPGPSAVINPPVVSQRYVMDPGAGPVATLPDRVVKLPDGTTQINPYNNNLGAQMARQGMGETGGEVPGGNVSVFQMSPEQQAEVAKRKKEGSAALDSYNTELDRQNTLAGAHGPAAARKAITLVASMDAAAGKTAHTAAQTALETEKAKADIFSKTAQAYKDLGLVDKSIPFDRQKATEKYMGIAKDLRTGLPDPAMANIMTDWEERKHAGTGVDINKKVELYNANFNKVPMHIYGVADKKHEKAANEIINRVIAAQKQYADSGFLGIGKSKEDYRAVLNAAADQLQKMGIVLMPDVETIWKG